MTSPLVTARPSRRRGRWWLMALPLVALLVLLLADRLLVGVAERRLSGRLACLGALTGTRAVHIRGFPFLTQVASGHFRKVTVTADGIRRAARLTDVTVTFHDLRLPPLSGLAGRPSPGSATVGSMVVTGTIRLVPAGPRAGLAGAGAFPVHLDVVQPVPDGLRVTLSVPGTAVNGVVTGGLCRR